MPEYETITITGHRDYPDRAALYRGLDNLSANQYYFGGAQGVDSDALEYIAKTQPESIRTVVVPNRVIDQPYPARAAIRNYATNVIELNNSGPDRYFIRNRYMVDHSQKTVSFYDFRGKGGTLNTMNYAQNKDKLLTTNSLVKFDEDEFMLMNKEQAKDWIENMRRFKLNLKCIKSLLLLMIKKTLNQTVSEFIEDMGYPGVNTLEQYWQQ